MLQEALDRAQNGGAEASFCVYVIGNCEWLFRVYDPGSVIIRKALQDRLQTPGYQPFPPVPHPWMLPQLAPCVQTGGVSLATNKYVDARLGEIWDRQASETCRRVLVGQLEDLVREFDQPFLPATLQPLSPKRGGYPELISWVVATVIYQCVKLSHPNKQDSQAIRAAQALVAALKNKADGVDRSQFHRKRRAIENTAPQLRARFVQGYEDLTEVRKISMEDVLTKDQGVDMTWYWLSEKEGAALLSST